VRVVTSDGWNTTSAQSGSFAIGGKLTDGRIAFANWGNSDQYTAKLDGSDRTKLPRRSRRVKYSADGTQLVYEDDKDLWVSDADGSNPRQVTHLTGAGDSYRSPVFSGDGTKLIAQRVVNGYPDHLAAVDVRTGEETPWGEKNMLGADICGTSRDGAKVVLWYAGSQQFQLVRADGTGGTFVPRAMRGYSCLSLSPDGRYGVATDYTDPSSILDVYVYDLLNNTRRNLTNGAFGGYNAYPTWSPTGDWIVWGSNKDRSGSTGFGATDLWRIHPDGTGAQKIVDGKPENLNFERPDIQPLRGIDSDPPPTLEEKLPVAELADATGVEGQEITLDASASTPGADGAALTSFKWDVDGDGRYEETGKVRFPDEGAYVVRVLVTDAKGRTSTAQATVTVTNADPKISDAKVDDQGGFGAKVTDVGGDELTAKLDGKAVPLTETGEGSYIVNGEGSTLVVTDGDGGRDEATAQRVATPVNQPPTAEDATATVAAGEAVDIALPAKDPEGQPLTYTLVTKPEHGVASVRAQEGNPQAADVTYAADPQAGTDHFTYKVSDGAGESRVATVTVTVTDRPDAGAPPVIVAPDAPPILEVPRIAHVGSKPVDPKTVQAATAPSAAETFTLPSTKACVSRRHFRIRVKKGSYKTVVVWVNGRRVKSLKGKRITAAVDLRGLPKGTFKVKIAATLATGKVVTDTRTYRTCTANKKKGAKR